MPKTIKKTNRLFRIAGLEDAEGTVKYQDADQMTIVHDEFLSRWTAVPGDVCELPLGTDSPISAFDFDAYTRSKSTTVPKVTFLSTVCNVPLQIIYYDSSCVNFGCPAAL